MKTETWGDILRPQAADLAITAAFFAFALVSFFRKSKPLKYAALTMSVAYLGVTKSTLISVTDIFRLVHFDFPQVKYSLAWYLIAGFTVLTTLLFGRLYCGRICAFGALLLGHMAAANRDDGTRRSPWLDGHRGLSASPSSSSAW